MRLTLTSASHVAGFRSVWRIHFNRPTDLDWLGELIEDATGLSAFGPSSDGKCLSLGANGNEWGNSRDEVCRVIAEHLGQRSVTLVRS